MSIKLEDEILDEIMTAYSCANLKNYFEYHELIKLMHINSSVLISDIETKKIITNGIILILALFFRPNYDFYSVKFSDLNSFEKNYIQKLLLNLLE